MAKQTNVADFFGSLGAGVTETVLATVLSDVAVAVLHHGGKRNGKITIELTVDKMSEDSENGVKINAKLSHKRPTSKGSRSEDETRESVFFVDPQRGLVDTPPKAKEEYQNQSMSSGMPAGSHRNS